MNNLLSYCGLVVARIRASEKDLPVPKYLIQMRQTKDTNTFKTMVKNWIWEKIPSY